MNVKEVAKAQGGEIMTEAQAMFIWRVILELGGMKNFEVEVHKVHKEEEEKKETKSA